MSNVIPLDFHARAVAVVRVGAVPFVLESGADGRWTIRGAGTPMTADDLVAAADTLRAIARDLTARAHTAAGFPPDGCLGEFVLHENGGIDHWISPNVRTAADRLRLKLGLRKATASIRER